MSKVKCEHCDREFSKYGIKNHIAVAHQGRAAPMSGKVSKLRGRTLSDGHRLKLSIAGKGKSHPHTEETRRKLSESMKKAHAEGRAHNIGKSRWNNEPSWPEKFFMQVIENEFDDKNYVREHPIGRYSIDFAWPDRKLAIEIDGQQHDRFDDIKARDKRKEALLEAEGWKLLRICWTDMYNDTKPTIAKAKIFLET